MFNDKLETIVGLKDEVSGVARRVAGAYEKIADSADDMADSVDKAEGRLSKIKSALAGVAKSHRMKLDPVNFDAVSKNVRELEGRLEKMTGHPVTIKATAKINKSQIKEAQSEAKRLKSELEALTGRKYTVDVDLGGSATGGGLSSLAAGAGGLLKSTAVGAGVAAVGAGVAGATQMFTGASQQQQYMASMTHFMEGDEKGAQEALQWAKENARATQFSSGEVMAGMSRAIQISDGNVSEAQRFVSLAEDMASLTPGKTISDAMEALADAQMGEFERLKEFGYKGSAEAFEASGGDFWAMKNLSNGKTIEEQFKGGTAAGADTTAAKIGTITGTLEDALTNVGTKILDYVDPALDWLVEASEEGGTRLQGALESVGSFLQSAGGVLGSVFQALAPVAQALAPVFSSVADIAGTVLATALDFLSGVVSSVVKPAMETIANIINQLVAPSLEWLSDRAKDAANILKKIGGVVNDVVSTLSGFGSRVIDAAVSGLSGFGGALVSAITGFFGGGKKNAQGAISFEGGFTQMNENARGEIVQLPRGSKIYPYSTTQKIIRDMVGKTDTGQKPQGRAIAEALARPVNSVSNNNVFNVSIDARGSNLSKQEVRRLKNEIVNSIVEAFDNTVPA